MAYSDLGMSPGQAQAMGGGYQGGDTEGDPGGFAESLGEAPAGGGGLFSTVKSFVDKVFSGTSQNTQKTVPSSQNFFQKNANIQALPDKDYTISKSGNTLYAPYNPNLVSAREKAENRDTGISDAMAFRGAVAGINPETGMMWSGGTKGGALDQLTNTMMTPQRFQQNIDRTDKYAAQSRNALRSQKGKVGLTAEQREINRQESLFNLDLDGDGNIFSSTDDDGVVYGMSNKAIYDPSLPEAYRGIPSRYATGLPTTNAATGALGNVYGGQKTSDDRMLANEIMSYVMPGAGLAKLGQYFFPGTTQEKTQSKMVNNNNQINKDLVFGEDNLTDQQILSSPSYSDMVPDYLMPPEIIGYRPDGSPVTASDPDAARWRGVGM